MISEPHEQVNVKVVFRFRDESGNPEEFGNWKLTGGIKCSLAYQDMNTINQNGN
jgi:hypothetical protein